MKKTIYIFLLLIIASNKIAANPIVIAGKIIDVDSKKGIPNVHVFSSKLNQGTITNADGNFYLIVAKNDELQISSIGYKEKIFKLLNISTDNLVIKLQVNIENLEEVIITANPVNVNDIMDKVFKNFKKNHLVEPVYYNFYNRVINYTNDSKLQSIEEYSGIVKQNRLHNTKYKIEKGRVKYLTEDSIQQLKDHRVITMDKMYIDNIYKYREDYLQKKGKRIYKYDLIEKSTILGRNCYVISFYTDKSTHYKKGELFIDMEDFAIIRKTLINSKNNEIWNDITFKKKNDKWYLKKAEDFHVPYGQSIYSTDYRITLYNYVDIEDSNLKFINLSVQNSTKITSNFNDNYWKNNNFIPLPNWIKKQIK